MKIFSGSSNTPLAEKVAKQLGLELSPIEIFVFPDGERRIQIQDNVVERDTVVIQPTNPPVDQNYMELFFIIDGLKRSGAKSVTAVVPYLGYQRQDHIFRDGEAVSLEVIKETLESTGLSKIIAFDLHTPKTPDIFTIPFVHLSALPLFAEEIKKLFTSKRPHPSPLLRGEGELEKIILISPDMGGIRRIKILSELLDNMPYAVIVKNRDLNTGKVEAAQIEFDGDISEFKTAIIVDDMISSGKTIIAAADLLKKNGIDQVCVFVTHPVFSEEAPELLQNSSVEKVFVTNGIDVPSRKRFEKLHVLSLAEMIAEELAQ